MGIYKQKQLKPAPPPAQKMAGASTAGGDASGFAASEATPEDAWLAEAEHVRTWVDRQLDDRRRLQYRRLNDQEIISRAADEAEAIREQARQAGYQAGLAEAAQDVEALQQQLTLLLQSRQEALADVASDVAGLAIDVAKKLLHVEISCDERLVLALVYDALGKAGRQAKQIMLHTHPAQTALVRDAWAQKPIPGMTTDFLVLDDPEVDYGSCLVETQSGIIDARFRTQWMLLRRLFNLPEEGQAPEPQQ
jgi:flagellar assembly protein FliH